MLVEDLTRSRAKLLKKTLECSRVQFAWTADGRILATLPTLDTATSHVKMCRWLTSYVPRSQFQVL